MKTMHMYKTRFNGSRQVVLVKENTTVPVTPISDIDTVARVLNEVFDLENQTEEYMYCLCLDTKHRIVGVFEISHGGIDHAIFEKRAIFQKALLSGCKSIILAHNHPSGDPNPSSEDISATKTIEEGATLLGLTLLDHVIVGNKSYYGFRAGGLIEN